MKDLTTRKIVLGLLMGLVLVFSVQGIADALTTMLSNTTPGDLSPLTVGDSVTLTFSADLGSGGTPDFMEIRESVRLSVSGGGGTFLVGNSRVSTYTWTEEDTTNDPVNDPVDHNDGTYFFQPSGCPFYERRRGYSQTVGYE